MKEQIETQTLNSGGVRNIGRNLNISKNTVISELKKIQAEVNPYFLSGSDELEIEIRTDESCSFLMEKLSVFPVTR